MATQDATRGACVTCDQPATTHCAGCSDVDIDGAHTPTLYCGKICQSKDWATHKKACQAAQSRKKLFRAAELIQGTFYAVRAEAFDLNVFKVIRTQNGKVHVFDKPATSKSYIERASTWAEGDPDIKRAVLSFSAGGGAFSNELYDLGVKALKGYANKIEELDVRMFDSRLLLHRHEKDTATAVVQNIHHVVCVTLKDDSVWIIDPAGAQHGQLKAVLPFSEYDRDYVAKVIARRPYGATKRYPEKFVQERHKQLGLIMVTFHLNGILEFVADELAEWEFKHVTVETIIKSSNSEYQRLKSMLLNHLATAACDSVKFSNGQQKSPGQPIIVRDTTHENISEAEKQRIARKRARLWATMDPNMRESVEKAEAEGNAVLMF